MRLDQEPVAEGRRDDDQWHKQ